MFETIEVTRGPRVVVIWLNRPTVHNAINTAMIKELTQAIDALADQPEVSALVLASRSDSFCSGTDLNAYQESWDANDPSKETIDVALSALLKRIDTCAVPVIARVHGHCVGVGTGLVAAADIVVASHAAEFTQSETSLGLTPHLVAPYLCRAIGSRSAARWLMTGETFSASEAWRLGLVHEICDVSELDARINQILGHLMTAEFGAIQATRKMTKALANAGSNELEPFLQAQSLTSAVHPDLSREGIAAYLEKRWPSWAPEALK